jgi:hypothetical protein
MGPDGRIELLGRDLVTVNTGRDHLFARKESSSVIPSRGSARAAVACLHDGGVGEREVMLSGVDVAVVQAALWHGSGEGHLDHVELGDPEDPELLAAAVALRATGRTYTFSSRPVS